ncbi:MAG TPA: hypothetical protein DDX19_13535 [Rhodopirellula baltica]|uniref:Uncharacterized protein n=1 Tax=Rhodopirellula baltica SWK14 TaxID=993516 RepID=L7CBE5_RHOBT|nr:hypothetical protein RBSWK_04908 [Rhodopirellula baltica SWK14]HBE63731.1 hypothetical protein [Rhodopirellula baltica]
MHCCGGATFLQENQSPTHRQTPPQIRDASSHDDQFQSQSAATAASFSRNGFGSGNCESD